MLQLPEMELSQKVAFNTAVQIVSKMVTLIFGLLTTILLTRYLGKAGFGDYTFVLTYVLIFGAFADWGTAFIGVREASGNEKERKEILGTIFFLRLGLSLLAVFLAILIIFILPLNVSDPGLVKQTILIASLLILLFATKASFGIAFQTRLELERLAVTDIIISLIAFSLSTLMILQNRGLTALVLVVVFANVLGVLMAFLLARKMMEFSLNLRWPLVKYLGKEALPMGAVLILFSIYNKLDTVMLGAIKGSSSVGIYGVAYRIYDVLVLGASYFMQSMLPVLSQELDRTRLKNLYQKSFDIILTLALLMLVSVFTFAPLMVRIIGGEEFAVSASVLRILVFANFLAYFNHLTGFTIVALKRQRTYFFISLTALLINVGLNLILIPSYSYFGAALVTVVTEMAVLIMTSFLVYRLIGFFPSVTSFPRTAWEAVKKRGKIF